MCLATEFFGIHYSDLISVENMYDQESVEYKVSIK